LRAERSEVCSVAAYRATSAAVL